MKQTGEMPVIGWRELVALPQLGVSLVRCKVDTGARTSALHAFYVEEVEENGVAKVRFGLHSDQEDSVREVHCVAPVCDRRLVSDSGGHQELRYVIRSVVVLGNDAWPIEITLTNRDSMRYRMLLGRTAIINNYVVDTSRSYVAGKPLELAVPRSFVQPPPDEEEE